MTLHTPKMETLPPFLQTQTSLRIPKMETPSPTMHSPLPPQHFSASTSKEEAAQCLKIVKEETLPPFRHLGLHLVNTRPPPAMQPGPILVNMTRPPSEAPPPTEPYWGDGVCIIEEEISPRWHLTDARQDQIAVEDKCTDRGEEGSHYAYHLAVEHLDILLDIQQRQDEQVHGKMIINQLLDRLYEEFSEAPMQA
jgi:hypothetical protein